MAGDVAGVMDHWLDAGATAGGWTRPTRCRGVLGGRGAAGAGPHSRAYLVGEVIHGNYPEFVAASGLDSVTQYELWKAIWSALNDRNLFELDTPWTGTTASWSRSRR